jgi:hypothetical protein
MQIISTWTRFSEITIVYLAVVALAAGGTSAKPIPVEFWHTGDDGLSQKLAYQVERAFGRSPDFTMRGERRPETLVVRIPTNVDWNKVGKRTQVLYTVEFSSADNQEIGVHKGSCWENAMSKCAAQIVKEAKIAAGKIHQK